MLVFLYYLFFPVQVLFFVTSIAEDIPNTDIYAFGDSSFVTGPRSDSWMKAGYLPYGTSCVYPQDTYRFSNGKTIPELISISLENKGLINYASASAGILTQTGTAFGKNLCFKEQIRGFEEYVEKDLKGKYHPEVLTNYLSKSIFISNIGASDYIHNYLQPKYYNTSNRYNGEEFAKLLIKEYVGYLKELHKIGARKIIIFQIGPLGCLPYVIENLKPRSRCAENINELVSKFNDKLDVNIEELRKELKGSQFEIARVYPLIENMIKSPTDYGFEETRWPCCPIVKNGTGLCKETISDEAPPPSVERPEDTSAAVQEWADSCAWSCKELPMPESLKRSFNWTGPNIDRECVYMRVYVFFDELHLSHAANRIIAERCLAGTGDTCSPRGIYQLVD